jgi:hypothetical protein
MRHAVEADATGRRGLATLPRRLADLLAQHDAATWGLERRQTLTIALLPVLAFCLIAASTPLPRVFRWIIDEDMLVETLQVVLILGVTVLAGRLSARLLREGSYGIGALYLLLTLGALFVTGEEISWGQRILGLRTPPALQSLNAQQEISVHNLHGMHGPFIYAAMLAGALGTLVPLVGLVLSAERRRSDLGRLLIPPLCVVPAFVMPFAYRFIRLVIRPEQYIRVGYGIFVITEFSEFTELCMYFGLLVFLWLNVRRTRRVAPAR